MPAAPGVSNRSILKLIETVRLIRGQRFVVLAFHTIVRISCFAQSDTSSESDKANAFIDCVFDEQVARYPERQTYLGIKGDYGKWNGTSDAMAERELDITKANLAWLKETIDYKKLDTQTKISYLMWVERVENQIRNFKYLYHNYTVNQMFGRHAGVPAFLINVHQLADEGNTEHYVERLRGVGMYLIG